ncbi:MAG: hypothetical protein IJ086_03665 [Clostridium sp.]|nr:hypothetical protein [Clostridium sp.]
MNTYENKLINRANKKLYSYDITQFEHLIINEFLDTNYKKNKKGFIDYISDLFFKEHRINLKEYQNLFDFIQ